jgi:hypothetical protein
MINTYIDHRWLPIWICDTKLTICTSKFGTFLDTGECKFFFKLQLQLKQIRLDSPWRHGLEVLSPPAELRVVRSNPARVQGGSFTLRHVSGPKNKTKSLFSEAGRCRSQVMRLGTRVAWWYFQTKNSNFDSLEGLGAEFFVHFITIWYLVVYFIAIWYLVFFGTFFCLLLYFEESWCFPPICCT